MQKRTYINECLKNDVLIRWPETLMPLRIYISPFRWYQAKNDANAEYQYKQMVMNALNNWTNATDGMVTFQIVPALTDSMINLDWKRVDRSSLGHCYFNFDNQGRLFSAEVQIGLSDGVIHQEYMSESEVYHTIIHEIGHALGLQHSPFKDDIMYVPHQYGVVDITPRDKNTLKWLYRLPYGTPWQEIVKGYGTQPYKSLDEMIYMLETNQSQSKFEQIKDETQLNQPSKDLISEVENIGNIKLYQQSLQRLELSDNIKNLVKKVKIDKDFK